MTTPAPEAEPQHGDHPIVLVVDQPRGVIGCSTCSRDIAAMPPEWLGEHNTDTEDQTPDPPGDPVDVDEVQDAPERLRPA